MTSKALECAKTYQKVKIKICQRLKQNWPEDNRLPPINELALELGEGKMNTHRAIKELVKDGCLVTRPKLGTYLSDGSDGLKAKLDNIIQHSGNSRKDQPLTGKRIQVLLRKSAVKSRFLHSALEIFFSGLSDSGAIVQQGFYEDGEEDPFVQYSEMDAIVAFNPHLRSKLHCASSSQVFMGIDTMSNLVISQSDRYDCLGADDTQGSFLAGQYLKSLGLVDACFIGALDEINPNPSGYRTCSFMRLDGFTKGLGHPIKPEHLFRIANYGSSAAAQVVPQWLKLESRPSAIFTASDEIAFGFINGAYAHGLKPGKDYQIIGFDGQQVEADPEIGWITTIKTPMNEMASLAAKMLVERMQNPDMTPRRVCLGCSLVKGDTVIPRNP
jgi:DNA-binding transcriptional regulator YhcF (GntR family)